jgi:hypothetical protein
MTQLTLYGVGPPFLTNSFGRSIKLHDNDSRPPADIIHKSRFKILEPHVHETAVERVEDGTY